ncbi:MAG TPA: SprT family zinc-dependent metalloprotease [Xanthobacteraceae bacterium]|nr:SprT family zinc-dependent metalloprotease [Xanthobacteraceae bacterium]
MVAGREILVPVKRNRRARRLILRIDAASGLPVVTLPANTSIAQGKSFLHKHLGWLEGRLRRAPGEITFRDGTIFPLRAAPCRIAHRGGRGLVELTAGAERVLSVPGDAEHLARRVTDWLKREARRDLQHSVDRCAQSLGRKPDRIRIGDARSRWGSCTAGGVLTFSWRLIFAPPHVLDYLAAHETAHLVEMNHGPRFWALVARLHPDFAESRAWLKQHGAGLHAIGRSP